MASRASEAPPGRAWRGIDSPLVLEGRHVRLEPLALQHLPDLCAIGLEPELWRWTIQQVNDEAAMRVYVEHALAERDAGTAYPFATIERATGRVAGSTRFAAIVPTHRRLEIGWTWLGRPWQRTPLNTEAKFLMLRHAFDSMGCNRVELKTDALNENSRRAILRIGARQEGRLRSHMVTASGRVRDTVYFSVIAEEWPAVRRRLEEMLA